MKLARQIARGLRQHHTLAEKLLWKQLRNRRFMNFKFLRQHPIFYKYNNTIKFFIADFYCHELKLVIEIDGRIHDEQIDYDQKRTEIINTKKIKIVRFTNEEIFLNIELVLQKMKDII
jgi:very-short-patch-repair endonuclease